MEYLITENLTELCKVTTVDVTLLNIFTQKGVISWEFREEIEKPTIINTTRAKLLFEGLRKQPEGDFDVILEGLEKSNNKKAVQILRTARMEDLSGEAAPSNRSGRPSNGNRKRSQKEDDISYLRNFKKTEKFLKWPISHGIKEPVKNFFGRDQEVTKLKSLIKNNRNLVLVCGFGGIGKTELCRKYIDNLDEKKSLLGIFKRNIRISRVWLHGDTFESLKSSVFSLAIQLGVTNDNASPSQMFKYLTEIILEHSRMLVVVVDNVDSKVEEVIKVIQKVNSHKNTFTIVTSRDRMILDNAGERMELGVISKAEAREILQNSIENLSDFDADSLSSLVQYYPLALQQAVAYVNVQRENVLTPKYSVFDYVQEFNQKQSQMLDHKLNNFEHDYANTTLVTWDVTFSKLSPVAIKLLWILAFLKPDRIEVDFFQQVGCEFCHNNEEFCDALNMLRNYCLIKVDELVISIHRLVQDVMRGKVEPWFAKEMFNVVGVVLGKRYCDGGLRDHGYSHMSRMTELAFQVEFNISNHSYLPENPTEYLFYIKSKIAYKLSKINNHSDSIELCEQVLSSNAKLNETRIYAFQALLNTSKTNLTLVIQLLEKIVESKKSTRSISGNQGIVIIQIKIVLASLIEDGETKAGFLREIRDYYELSDKSRMGKFYTCIFMEIIIGEDWATRDFIYKCARTFDYSEDLDFEYLERLLPFYKCVLGENDLLTARVKNRIAWKFYSNKEYAKSLELLEQIISSNIFENEVEIAYSTMNSIAIGFYRDRNYNQAKLLFERTIKGTKNKYDVIYAKCNLAKTLFELGCELIYARYLCRDVIFYYKEGEGKDDYDVKEQIEEMQSLFQKITTGMTQ